MQMKATYIKSFMAAALSMLMLGSCVQEELEKGTPELEGCMGVYFVEGQANAKDHTLEKGKDKSSLDFTVRRINSEKAAEIPYEYTVYKVVQNMAPGDTHTQRFPSMKTASSSSEDWYLARTRKSPASR